MKLRNINPLGAVVFPLIGKTLERGEVFDVPDELGAELLKQDTNYELAVDADTSTPAPTDVVEA